MEHSHPNDGLVFACPACRAEVEADQRRAEVDAAPLRRCMVSWRAEGRDYAGPAQLKVPAGWDARQVLGFYLERLGEWLDRQVAKEFASGKQMTAAAGDARVTKISIGVLVDERRPPPVDQPSLFE